MGERRPATPDVTGYNATVRMEDQKSSLPWKHVAVVVWLAFSVAIAVWWMVFGLQQIDRLSGLGMQAEPDISTKIAHELVRQHRMLVSEGTTLILLLIAGGAALLYYIHTEIGRANRVQEFLGAFTHDIKTSLASLRLQAESLEEDLKDSGHGRLARRLVKDTVRLELQLENSLLLAAPDGDSSLLIEPLRFSETVEMLRHHWPDLDIHQDGDGIVRADKRALESILKNLVQNAVVHGRASKVNVDVARQGPWLRARVSDDGRGFQGEDQNKLGRMFERHTSTSGSGLGLALGMKLARRMGGDLTVVEASNGFAIELILPQEPPPEETPE
ncbi:MAG: HAMP domain-containing sensor histidine kinase [Bdellovibrionota bacterium]